eukprot:15329300-Ditylum_brightwellii.AAC.1
MAQSSEPPTSWRRFSIFIQTGNKKDLAEALEFGNHKGAINNPKLLTKMVEKDIRHGYGLVIPLHKLDSIPGAILAPMNIMKQNTIDERGRIVEKDRLTHNQSYEWSSG